MARIAKSLDTLRAQVNAAYPNRSKSSDGWIGDAAHRARKSDHNPNQAGVVQALDITHDPAHGLDAGKLADALLASHDERIKYIISNRRIGYSSDWKWRPYSGTNAHTQHCHVSVKDAPILHDDPRRWSAVGAIPSRPTFRQMRIVATVFGGPDDPNQSAYGGRVDPQKPGVALPDRFEGVRPKVRVFANGKSVVAEIVDVGPWNHVPGDPYWETGRRPLVEAQFSAGLKAQNGRVPTNMAAIDLTPAAAKAIGIQGKGWVDWEFVTATPAAPPSHTTTAVVAGGGIVAVLAGIGAWFSDHPAIVIPIFGVAMIGVTGVVYWLINKSQKK
jgi:hypothetical protein